MSGGHFSSDRAARPALLQTPMSSLAFRVCLAETQESIGIQVNWHWTVNWSGHSTVGFILGLMLFGGAAIKQALDDGLIGNSGSRA